MALPTILVNSATGSDTQASGAGPSTALFGTTDASFSGATVTLTAGTDLTNVATDGSHVLYLLTSTGVRFFKITAKAGSGGATPTVDVTPNPAGTSTGRTWAIGGKRAALASASTKLLFDQGGSTGDIKAGWSVELASGYAETISATFDWRCNGDTTDGPITLRGEAGGTRPILTFSNNGSAFVSRGIYHLLKFLELRNSNATKTASIAWGHGSNGQMSAYDVKVSHSTDKFWKAWTGGAGYPTTVENCDIGFCVSHAFETSGEPISIRGCNIHDCGGRGYNQTGGSLGGLAICDNTFDTNGSDGLFIASTGGTQMSHWVIERNTFYSNSGDGIDINDGTMRTLSNMSIRNNIFKSNGGYGINFSFVGADDDILKAYYVRVTHNVFHGNTSGKYNPTSLTLSENEQTVDPNFVDAANGDFTPQEATLEGTAFPTSIP